MKRNVLAWFRLRYAAATFVMAALVVGCIGLAGGSANASSRSTRRSRSSSLAALTDGYAVLKRVHVAVAPPGPVQSDLSLLLPDRAPQLGLDPSGVQQVDFGQVGSVWVEPGTQGMCVVLDTIALDPLTGKDFTFAPYGCETAATALTSGVAAAMTVGSEHIVWGVVPNGNTQVLATFPSGDSQELPVTNNAILVDTATAPEWLSFGSAAGVSETIPVGPLH